MTDFLTSEHLKYLQHVEVPVSAVPDARNKQRSIYRAELKRQNKALAYVSNACGKVHQLRLRLGSAIVYSARS